MFKKLISKRPKETNEGWFGSVKDIYPNINEDIQQAIDEEILNDLIKYAQNDNYHTKLNKNYLQSTPSKKVSILHKEH